MSTVPFNSGSAAAGEFTARSLRTQKDVIRDVMLAASESGAWLTLKEIRNLTDFGEASISAQLRHLKADGFTLSKRCRESAGPKSGGDGRSFVTHEYLLEAKQ